MKDSDVARALREVFRQPFDSEPQTITEAVGYIKNGLYAVATAISGDAAPGRDAADGHVGCLTEAVMGITAGLFAISKSISDLSDSVDGLSAVKKDQ